MECHILVVGMWNDSVSLEKSWAISQKDELKLSCGPEVYQPSMYIPRKTKDGTPHINLYTNVNSSSYKRPIIYNVN